MQRSTEKEWIQDGHAFGINPVGFEVPLKNRNGDVRLTSPRSPWFFMTLTELPPYAVSSDPP